MISLQGFIYRNKLSKVILKAFYLGLMKLALPFNKLYSHAKTDKESFGKEQGEVQFFPLNDSISCL